MIPANGTNFLRLFCSFNTNSPTTTAISIWLHLMADKNMISTSGSWSALK
ncbi:hypothetical protein HW347_16325 [Zobellia sp. KMM 6746]|uniref:Uncharacterized protein n=1 Tax=Zobellia barbeyronii TaxID=2748009 RepID=A0ABS5WJ25_9FLAO|nr:hypothetical protein [Zobellia barbeyronii]